MSNSEQTTDPNIRPVLHISPDHLDRPSRKWLDGQEVGALSSPTNEGWLLLNAPRSIGDLTPVLRRIVEQAERQDCAATWITDGAPVHPALPTFPQDD